MLRVDAGTTQKKKFTDAVRVGRADDIVLQLKILEKELGRLIIVGLDSAHASGSDNNNLRFFAGEEHSHRFFLQKIQFRAISDNYIPIAFRAELPNDRAPDKSAVTRNE